MEEEEEAAALGQDNQEEEAKEDGILTLVNLIMSVVNDLDGENRDSAFEFMDKAVDEVGADLMQSALLSAVQQKHEGQSDIPTIRIATRFLLDSGANVSLVRALRKLSFPTKSTTKSSGVAGAFQANKEGYIDALLPTVGRTLLRAVHVPGAEDDFEIISQMQLEHVGFVFVYSLKVAFMITPSQQVIPLERDSRSGLWMIHLDVQPWFGTNHQQRALSAITHNDAFISQSGDRAEEEQHQRVMVIDEVENDEHDQEQQHAVEMDFDEDSRLNLTLRHVNLHIGDVMQRMTEMGTVDDDELIECIFVGSHVGSERIGLSHDDAIVFLHAVDETWLVTVHLTTELIKMNGYRMLELMSPAHVPVVVEFISFWNNVVQAEDGNEWEDSNALSLGKAIDELNFAIWPFGDEAEEELEYKQLRVEILQCDMHFGEFEDEYLMQVADNPTCPMLIEHHVVDLVDQSMIWDTGACSGTMSVLQADSPQENPQDGTGSDFMNALSADNLNANPVIGIEGISGSSTPIIRYADDILLTMHDENGIPYALHSFDISSAYLNVRYISELGYDGDEENDVEEVEDHDHEYQGDDDEDSEVDYSDMPSLIEDDEVDEYWQRARQNEMETYNQSSVWDILDATESNDRRMVQSTWTFTIKGRHRANPPKKVTFAKEPSFQDTMETGDSDDDEYGGTILIHDSMEKDDDDETHHTWRFPSSKFYEDVTRGTADDEVSDGSILSMQGHGAVDFGTLHSRLGCQNDVTMRRTLPRTSAQVNGAGIHSTKSCPICDKLKLRKASRSIGFPRWISTTTNVILVMDMHGPMNVPGLRNERYFQAYIDVRMEKSFVFNMKRKNDAITTLNEVKAEYMKRNIVIKEIWSDQDKVYLGEGMDKLCQDLGIKNMYFPAYVKNPNRAEQLIQSLELRGLANITIGCATPRSWPLAVSFGSQQRNKTVKLSSENAILHHITPDQLFNCPVDIISQAYKDLEGGGFNYEEFILNVNEENWNFCRKFWSRSQVHDPTKSIGQFQMRVLDDTHVYVGIGAEGNAFKFLNLRTLETVESASAVINESTTDLRDQLTGFDKGGGATHMQARDKDAAERIRQMFDTSGKQEFHSTDFDDPLEGAGVGAVDPEAPFADIAEPIDDEESDEEVMDDSGEPSIEKADQRLSEDIDGARERRTLNDGELRSKKSQGKTAPVIRRGVTTGAALEDDTSFCKRVRRANLPITYEQVNVKKSPSKSFDRYEKYKKFKTIEDAIQKGGARWADIVWDYKHGLWSTVPDAELQRLSPLVQRIVYESDLNLDKEICFTDAGQNLTSNYPLVIPANYDKRVCMFRVPSRQSSFGVTGTLGKRAPILACGDDADEGGEKLVSKEHYTANAVVLQHASGNVQSFYSDATKALHLVPPILQHHALPPESFTNQHVDDELHESDHLYRFRVDVDHEVVAPLKCFVRCDEDDPVFVKRNDLINCVTRSLEKLIGEHEPRSMMRDMDDVPPHLKEMNEVLSMTMNDFARLRINNLTNGADPDSKEPEVDLKEVTPKNYKEAIQFDPDRWYPSMMEEMAMHVRAGTWEIVPKSSLLPSDNITGMTWTYTIKRSGRRKSRACARGFSQRKNIDFFEVFSSTVTTDALRVGIALAAGNNRLMSVYDVKGAYLESELPKDERVFCEQAKGFEIRYSDDEDDKLIIEWFKSKGLEVPDLENGTEVLYAIRRSLYGLRSSSRQWNQCFTAWAVSKGFVVLKSDDCVFRLYRKAKEEDFPKSKQEDEASPEPDVDVSDLVIDIELYLYVDDAFVTFGNEESRRFFKKIFHERWDASEGTGGDARAMLGMDITPCDDGTKILLSQTGMIEDIAEKFDVKMGKDWKSPMAKEFDGSYDEDGGDLDQDEHPYKSLIGSLLYVVMHSRPDCAVSMSMLCSAMAKPQAKHWQAGLRLARYLYLTKDLGLSFTSNMSKKSLNKLSGMVDASWCAEKGSRSREAYLLKLNGATVSFSSKKISTICLSSAEAETTAAVSCMKQLLWLRMLMWELDYPQVGSTEVGEDSKATIDAASGNSQRKASRYYQMRTAYLRSLVKTGIIHLSYVNTTEQTADALSKNLNPPEFMRHQPQILGKQPIKKDEEN